MNLMTQDVDDDLEVLMQPDSTPRSGGKGASKHGGNYTHNEDIQLCISWTNINNDPIVANEQPSKIYWQRIADDFHSNKTFESDRSANSLEYRCGVIIKDCMKFQGYFEEVERRHPSGVPYKRHIMEVQARYARADLKAKAFQLVHCWLKVRHSEKFTSLEQNRRPAQSRELNLQDGSHQDGEGYGQEISSIPLEAKKARPPGRKQSKEKLKRNEGEDKYKGLMQNFVLMKSEEQKK